MNKQTQTVNSSKKPYTPPKLIVFGSVRSLSQSGATLPGENKGGKKKSSRMSKENIARIGMHPLGIGLYLFDYKVEYREQWGYGRQFGVMADEVEMIMPDAVAIHFDGDKVVDYAMLGITTFVH